jgi:hypothetical protein
MTSRLLILFSILAPAITFGQYKNVMISDKFSPNETSIMIDADHPEKLIAAANLNNYYLSADTGKTWTTKSISSAYGVWGDPALIVDAKSNFYFFHLSNPDGPAWVDRIICQKSSNAGNTWTDESFTGLNGSKVQDKPWITVNRKTNHMYVTWTQFDAYGSGLQGDSSTILFAKSVDDGLSWSDPIRINKKGGDCLDDDNTVEGAVPAIGPDGQIYVSWVGPQGIIFDKSYDDGITWMNNDKYVTSVPGGWAYSVPGIYRANGLPVTVCDTSATTSRGNIYINWTDQRNGIDNTDVWVVKSSDGGETWSDLIKVNNDNSGHHQFLSWLTIDQVTGYLYIVFYDRRNYDDTNTDVYLATSKDGGTTFTNEKISSTPFVPNETVFFGDYTNIVAYNNIVRPTWTRLHSGKLSVWTIVEEKSKPVTTANSDPFVQVDPELEVYPNPAIQETYVSFKLRDPASVTLSISDHLGREVITLIDNQQYPQGKHIVKVSVPDSRLTNGIYYYVLNAGKVRKTKRMVILR